MAVMSLVVLDPDDRVGAATGQPHDWRVRWTFVGKRVSPSGRGRTHTSSRATTRACRIGPTSSRPASEGVCGARWWRKEARRLIGGKAAVLAGAFGAPVAIGLDSRRMRVGTAVGPHGRAITMNATHTLLLATVGATNGEGRSVDASDAGVGATRGCLCALQGSLYEPQAIAHELGLPATLDDVSLIGGAYRALGLEML